MKDRKAVKKTSSNPKLQLPSNFIWKLFGKLLIDLGCSKDKTASGPFTTDRSHTEWAQAYYDAYRSRDLTKLDKCLGDFGVQRIVDIAANAEEFFVLHQLAAFLKKFPFPGNKEKTKVAAMVKFLETEQQCFNFNNENYKAILALNEKHPQFFGIIEELREDIEKLLGPTPPLEKIYGMASHGPGTSVEPKQHDDGRTTSFFKWSSLPYTVTPNCRAHAMQAIKDDPRWLGALDDWYRREHLNGDYFCAIEPEKFWDTVLRVVHHSRYATVPKTAQTDRSICIEPMLNVFIQLGVDGYIRGRLLRLWNIDLNTQEVNQLLALEGSLTDLLATLDLRGASDTVTLMCCMLLLPEAWVALLYDLRCDVTLMDFGTPEFPLPHAIKLEKVSSMGNGFTFVLESVIFAALTRVAIRRTGSPKTYSVYGDDIIVSSRASGFLINLLELFGFRLNKDKSFITGPFRESCGTDYYKGTNVRPVFVTDVVTHVTDLLYVHNAFFALEQRLPWYFGITFRNCKEFCRAHLPNWVDRSFEGPPSETFDSYIFSHSTAYYTRSEKRDNNHQWVHSCITPVALVYKKKRKDFYFIKLMCQLRPRGQSDAQKWMKRKRKLNTGNAFDITKRDHVRYVRTERRLWFNPQ